MTGAMRDWFSRLGEYSIKHRLAVRRFRKKRARGLLRDALRHHGGNCWEEDARQHIAG